MPLTAVSTTVFIFASNTTYCSFCHYRNNCDMQIAAGFHATRVRTLTLYLLRNQTACRTKPPFIRYATKSEQIKTRVICHTMVTLRELRLKSKRQECVRVHCTVAHCMARHIGGVARGLSTGANPLIGHLPASFIRASLSLNGATERLAGGSSKQHVTQPCRSVGLSRLLLAALPAYILPPRL